MKTKDHELHPIFIKGIFAIDDHLPTPSHEAYSSDYRLWGLSTARSGIACPGYMNEPAAEIGVKLVAHTTSDLLPAVDHCYLLSGRFLPQNEMATPHILFRPDSQIRVCKTEDFIGSSTGSVSCIACGIITNLSYLTEPGYNGKQTVAATLQHNDYDPKSRSIRTFTALYLCRPELKIKSKSPFQVGREVTIDCDFVGFDFKKCNFIFDAHSISISSGVLPETCYNSLNLSSTKTGNDNRLWLDDKRMEQTPPRPADEASTSLNSLPRVDR